MTLNSFITVELATSETASSEHINANVDVTHALPVSSNTCHAISDISDGCV